MQQTNVHDVRICIVSPLPPPYGGMSLQAEKLGRRLASEGFDVELLPTNPPFPRWLGFAESVPVLRTMIREVIYLKSLWRGFHEATVVHHLSKCGFYFLAITMPLLVLGRLHGKRLVLNYRGGQASAFLATWSWIVVPLMHIADSVTVPSDYLRRVFDEHGLSVSLVPNLVETGRFPYAERAPLRPHLLVTRHLEPLYNVECLLRAFRILKSRFPEAELTVAGTGSEERRLRNLCAEWNLDGVRFSGFVSLEDLPALYAAHDMFVNSSLADNFPGALVEAACSGLPIVTTKAGGIPDMIRDRENGLLVNLNDHEALAAGVIELLETPELARQLAHAARQWAEQFSWSSTLSSLLVHYGFSQPAAGSKWNPSPAAHPSSSGIDGRQ